MFQFMPVLLRRLLLSSLCRYAAEHLHRMQQNKSSAEHTEPLRGGGDTLTVR